MEDSTRPPQAVTGWPASCLSLGAHHYAEAAHSPTWPGTPVSADADAHHRITVLTNHIRGRMLKIQATADEHKQVTR